MMSRTGTLKRPIALLWGGYACPIAVNAATIRSLSSLSIGLVIGLLSWTGAGGSYLPILLLPIFWARLSPLAAGLLIGGYFLAGARAEPGAIASFFPSVTLIGGILLTIAHVLLLAAPFTLAAWVSRGAAAHWKGVAFAAALLSVSIPPLGVFGIGGPLILAADLFPGTGLLGLLAGLFVLGGLASMAHPALQAQRERAVLLLCLFLVSAWCWVRYVPSAPPAGWAGLDTALAPYRKEIRFSHFFARNQQLVDQVQRWIEQANKGAFLLLPEDAVGPWGAGAATLWAPVAKQAKRAGVTVALGVEVPTGRKLRSYDAVLLIGRDKGMLVARQPIPLGSWTPWAPATSQAASWNRWGGSAVGSRHVALSMCYEQLLTWPLAQAFASGNRPTVILAPSNHWWAPVGSSEPSEQLQAALAWGRLYDVPVITADNQNASAIHAQ